jgi:hypothetical protein
VGGDPIVTYSFAPSISISIEDLWVITYLSCSSEF